MTTPERLSKDELAFAEERAAAGLPLMQATERLLLREIRALHALLVWYEGALEDKRMLAREIDVALCGEDGAAKRPALCDVLATAKNVGAEVRSLRVRTKALYKALRRVSINSKEVLDDRSDPRHVVMCLYCGKRGRIETHAPDCLAAPREEKLHV